MLSLPQVGGVRQVIRPRKSESDKTDKAKPSEEEVEEFGEEKKEKPSTAVVSGAKTGQWHETCCDSQLTSIVYLLELETMAHAKRRFVIRSRRRP